ncbi:MAG: GNAT family N-acetyltransferase [Planctomycetes bacterium]|nr:GNAT family N-acetyltransferase [Planctomycetota bacterium]
MPKIFPAQTVEDFEIARKILVEYVDSLGFDLSFQDIEQELADLPSHFTLPQGCLLLAIHDNQAAGCVALKRFENNVCEMERLYVKPQFRRLGIGRALAENIITQARKLGYDYMRLHTILPREAARKLYFSLGFEGIEPYCYNPMKNVAFMELKLV